MEENLYRESALILGGNNELAITLAKVLIARGITPVLTYATLEEKQEIVWSLFNYHGDFDTLHFSFNIVSSKEDLRQLLNGYRYFIDFNSNLFVYEQTTAHLVTENDEVYAHNNYIFRETLLDVLIRNAKAQPKTRLVFVPYIGHHNDRRKNIKDYQKSLKKVEELYRLVNKKGMKDGISSIILRLGCVQECQRSGNTEFKTGAEIPLLLRQQQCRMVSDLIFNFFWEIPHEKNTIEVNINAQCIDFFRKSC